MKLFIKVACLSVVICSVPLYAPQLLRDRTISRQSNQQLDTLLKEIGVATVAGALKKVQNLPELLEALDSKTALDALKKLPERATVAEVTDLMHKIGTTTVSQSLAAVDKLHEFFDWLGSETISEAWEVTKHAFDELAQVKSELAALQKKHDALLKQCKRVEQEVHKISQFTL